MKSFTVARAFGVPTTRAYQTMLVGLLGVNLGFVFLDRSALGLLAPMIQPEFSLSNAQVGMITGILAATWALSSFGLARAADLTGRSKLLLIAGTVIFSVASIGSGLAIGFLSLLAARALMGLSEGGMPPISTHIVTSEVAPERRGLAIGMLSTIGLFAVPLLGPLVIVGIGTLWGWRHAFWIAGGPGLVVAILMWWLVRNPERRAPTDVVPRGSIIPLVKLRNIRFTMTLATLQMTAFVGVTGFLPLYLVKVLGLSNPMMGVVVTAQGVVMVAYGFIGPMLSDHFGRKPALISSFVVAALGWLVLAFSGGSLPLVFVGSILAGGSAGSAILIMNVIPGESAPLHLKATAMGFNAAFGEMLGAGAMPVAIGWAADKAGLGILPWVLMGFSVLAMLVTLGLDETAPKLVPELVARPA
jgi:ACS family hexuronate transporter-like MFS transporter